MTRLELAGIDEFFADTSYGLYRVGFVEGKRTGSRRKTASISCPRCGLSSSLAGHDIDADGKVSPSVVCPHLGCGFHDHITLSGWGA